MKTQRRQDHALDASQQPNISRACRCMAWLGIVNIAAFGSIGERHGAWGDERRAMYTAEQLRASILECQDKLLSIKVAYRSEAYEDSSFPRGTYLYRVVAAKSPNYHYHLSAHGHEKLGWRNDPLCQISYVQDIRVFTEYPIDNSYFITAVTPDGPIPGTLPEEFFYNATGVWPTNQREPPRAEGRPFVLREVAVSDDYSDVRPLQELVNGRWCHVLACPPVDYLWIDVERGCALMARENYTTSKVLVQRYELAEHREVASGIWLPMRLRNIQFDYDATTSVGRDRRIVDAWFAVEEIAVNNVSDELFDFHPSPGALLLKDDFRPELECPIQEEAGGLEYVDRIVEWRQLVSPPESPDKRYGWLAGVPAIPVVTFLEVRRRWRQRKA